MQYQVIIKNGWYKRVKDEVTGEETRVFETREIAKNDMEKVAKTAVPWKIMKKLVDENNFELAYDGNQKVYSTSAAYGPVDGNEYAVKVKRDCEDHDPDADRLVFFVCSASYSRFILLTRVQYIFIFSLTFNLG